MQKNNKFKRKRKKPNGKNGREKIIKEFDEKIVIDKYIKAINEILKVITK